MESIVGRLKNIASMQQFFVSPSGAAEDPSRSPLCAPVTAHPGGSFYGGRETKDERRGTKDGDTSFVTASPCHLPLQGKALRGDEGRGTKDGGRRTEDEGRRTKDGGTSFVTASPCHLPLQGKALRGDVGRGTGDEGRGHLIRHGFAVPPSPPGEGFTRRRRTRDGGRAHGCAPLRVQAHPRPLFPVPFAPYSLQRRTLCAAEVQSRASAVSESSRPGLRRTVKSMAQ